MNPSLPFSPAIFRRYLKPVLSRKSTIRDFHSGDDSLPLTPPDSPSGPPSWRQLPAPRMHWLLSGTHRIAFLKNHQPETVTLLPGDNWYMPENAHDYEYFQTKCSYLGAVFYAQYVRLILVDYPYKNGTIFRTPHWFHWHGARPQVVEQHLALMTALSRLPTEAASRKINRSAAKLFWLLLDQWIAQTDFTKETGTAHGKAQASWSRIHQYLNENYHLPINRETAASALGLHSSRIYALCREFTGKSFHDLLEAKRLTQAKRYLETTPLKIDAVARMSGYSGAPYFIRTFRAATGTTPSHWRIQHAPS